MYHIENKLSKIFKEFCKENFNIKLVFNPFKIKKYFSYKDPIPDDLKSLLVYNFFCANYRSSYIGDYFKTRIEEHIRKEKKSHIFKYLHFHYSLRHPFFFFVFVFFFFCFFLSFSFHLLFSFSLTLFIGTYYCLNYNSLLLHFIITHLTSHLSLSSIIFIVSDPNYRHLSLP